MAGLVTWELVGAWWRHRGRQVCADGEVGSGVGRRQRARLRGWQAPVSEFPEPPFSPLQQAFLRACCLVVFWETKVTKTQCVVGTLVSQRLVELVGRVALGA